MIYYNHYHIYILYTGFQGYQDRYSNIGSTMIPQLIPQIRISPLRVAKEIPARRTQRGSMASTFNDLGRWTFWWTGVL